jgi:hypothetical protein
VEHSYCPRRYVYTTDWTLLSDSGSPQLTESSAPRVGAHVPSIDPDLTRVMRQMPFTPVPLLDDPVNRIRAYMPDPATRDQLLHVFHTEIGDSIMFAFTREYVQGTVIPRTLHGEGCLALFALSTLFSLMAIGALFVVPGPGEAFEVNHYGQMGTVAAGCLGSMTSLHVEAIEATYARVFLELLRQGPLEEPARSSLATACHRSLMVSGLSCTAG